MRARRGPSRKATDRRPPRKLKCEKQNRAKLKRPEVDVCANTSSSLFSKELANKISEANECLPHSPVLKMMLQGEGELIPKISAESLVDQTDLCAESSVPGANDCSPKAEEEPLFPPSIHNGEEEEEEGEEASCRSGCSDDSEMEPEELQDGFLELDNSAFLNEDSNQPLPVDRFFGSVAFMQDLPAPTLVRAPANRREFRKLHFIAKDDDDDEEDEEGV